MVKRGDYGYDAPYALALLTTSTLIGVALAGWGWWTGHLGAVRGGLVYGVLFGLGTATFLHTTRRGKFLVWEDILDSLGLRGSERVLDLGCGRGAVLTAAARRLTTGRVTGIDLWRGRDQSGNAAAVTFANAEHEGVRERVDICTADMRALPFADGSFDVVVSSLAIHNIADGVGRAQAVREALRVLAFDGRLAIADIRATRDHVETLRALGATDIQRGGLGWRFWFANPLFGRTTLVTARKPRGAPAPLAMTRRGAVN